MAQGGGWLGPLRPARRRRRRGARRGGGAARSYTAHHKPTEQRADLAERSQPPNRLVERSQGATQELAAGGHVARRPPLHLKA